MPASAVGIGFIVVIIALDVAGEPVTQVAFDVITQVIISPFASDVLVYVEFVAPVIFVPLFFHWYVGAIPPFVGLAVNVTLVPAHIAPVGTAAMLTLAGKFVLTVIIIALDVAGEPVTQVAFDVITQVIISPFASDVLVYVEFVAPVIFVPLFFHWYVGATPPFVGLAVNVTFVPAHIAPAGTAAILMLASKIGSPVTVTSSVAVQPFASVTVTV